MDGKYLLNPGKQKLSADCPAGLDGKGYRWLGGVHVHEWSCYKYTNCFQADQNGENEVIILMLLNNYISLGHNC